MSKAAGFDERCQSYINCHLRPAREGVTGQRRLAVTLSRQTGSAAHEVGERLADILQTDQDNRESGRKSGRSRPRDPDSAPAPWTVFDRNLVEKVLEDHNLPSTLAKFMAEDHMSEINDTMDELFGLHPPSWTLVRDTADTILRLAQLGNVILIGRGAAVVTSKLDHVFHVRLVGSLEVRAKRWQDAHGVSHKEALEQIRREDRGRARYLNKYFKADIEDPLLYHLVINTDHLTAETTAQVIAEGVRRYAEQPGSPGERSQTEVPASEEE